VSTEKRRSEMPRTFETEREGRVLMVRFDNPPFNFINREMVAELGALLDSLEDDRSVGAVVLTGKPGDLFITHYDVEEILAGSEGVGRTVSAGVAGASLQTVGTVARLPGARAALRRTPAAGLLELGRIHDLFLRVQRMDKVFVAAINGPALGGGC
jgi:enoyl-CoA hydratase/carnithine racemase